MRKLAVNPLQAIVSSQYRHRLKRELADHDRLAAVYGSNFWNRPNDEKLTKFCDTAAMMLDCPVAHITLITDDTQRVVASNTGIAPDFAQGPLPDFSICQHVVGLEDPVAVANIAEEPMVCHVNVAVNGGMNSYLGVPLIVNGQILGALCVLDFKERDWSEIDVTAMTQLASALVSFHEVGAL